MRAGDATETGLAPKWHEWTVGAASRCNLYERRCRYNISLNVTVAGSREATQSDRQLAHLVKVDEFADLPKMFVTVKRQQTTFDTNVAGMHLNTKN